jgi:hypothetical protein
MSRLEQLEAEINRLSAEIAERERELRVGREAMQVLPQLRTQLQKVAIEYINKVAIEYNQSSKIVVELKTVELMKALLEGLLKDQQKRAEVDTLCKYLSAIIIK